MMRWNWFQPEHPGWQELLWALSICVAAIAVSLLLHAVIFWGLRLWSDRRNNRTGLLLYQYWRTPARFLLPVGAVLLAFPSLPSFPGAAAASRHLLALLLIVAAAWMLSATVFLLRSVVLQRFDVTVSDNLKARAVHTQVNVLVKVLLVMIGVVTLASLLMTFDKVRQVGVSLLASAGLVGVIAGFAAQSSLATLFAGIQMAVTQPIRIDDVVIVEGEWGRVEEITLTYVVIRIWDQRRLVVPITYFLEKPFQNWTRVSSDLLGTVTLHTDYRVPVAEVRDELHRQLQDCEDWDGKVWGLQVTGANEQTIELRALMSAPDATSAWNLRCAVRERLIDYLQRQHPEALPRLRGEWGGPVGAEPQAPSGQV